MLNKIGKLFIVCQIRYSLLLNILLPKKKTKKKTPNSYTRKKWDTTLSEKKYRWEQTHSIEYAERNPI